MNSRLAACSLLVATIFLASCASLFQPPGIDAVDRYATNRLHGDIQLRIDRSSTSLIMYIGRPERYELPSADSGLPYYIIQARHPQSSDQVVMRCTLFTPIPRAVSPPLSHFTRIGYFGGATSSTDRLASLEALRALGGHGVLEEIGISGGHGILVEIYRYPEAIPFWIRHPDNCAHPPPIDASRARLVTSRLILPEEVHQAWEAHLQRYDRMRQ